MLRHKTDGWFCAKLSFMKERIVFSPPDLPSGPVSRPSEAMKTLVKDLFGPRKGQSNAEISAIRILPFFLNPHAEIYGAPDILNVLTVEDILGFKVIRRGAEYGNGVWYAYDKRSEQQHVIPGMGPKIFAAIQQKLTTLGLQMEFEGQIPSSGSRRKQKKHK